MGVRLIGKIGDKNQKKGSEETKWKDTIWQVRTMFIKPTAPSSEDSIVVEQKCKKANKRRSSWALLFTTTFKEKRTPFLNKKWSSNLFLFIFNFKQIIISILKSETYNFIYSSRYHDTKQPLCRIRSTFCNNSVFFFI